MTSIINMFTNLNYLPKNEMVSPSLTQGSNYQKSQGILEHFAGLNINELNLSENGLTKESNNIIKTNDYSSQQNTIDELRQHYDETLQEYEKILEEIHSSTKNYFDRISSSNPYLGKNIQFTTGQIAYVTYQGVVKIYPNNNNLNGTSGANGCPKGNNVSINLPWLSEYSAPGITIPTEPPLITGTPMKKGQSCGLEGKNVFVNSLVSNPESSYMNCYNNIPQPTEIMFIPKMGPSNRESGFKSSASSVYNNDNNFTGPWNAFNRDVNSWWHTSGDPKALYNPNTGLYQGKNNINFINSSGQNINVKGEFLQINLPEPIP